MAASSPQLRATAEQAICTAAKASEGDSNDTEIGALWDAVDALAELAGIDAETIRFA